MVEHARLFDADLVRALLRHGDWAFVGFPDALRRNPHARDGLLVADLINTLLDVLETRPGGLDITSSRIAGNMLRAAVSVTRSLAPGAEARLVALHRAGHIDSTEAYRALLAAPATSSGALEAVLDASDDAPLRDATLRNHTAMHASTPLGVHRRLLALDRDTLRSMAWSPRAVRDPELRRRIMAALPPESGSVGPLLGNMDGEMPAADWLEVATRHPRQFVQYARLHPDALAALPSSVLGRLLTHPSDAVRSALMALLPDLQRRAPQPAPSAEPQRPSGRQRARA